MRTCRRACNLFLLALILIARPALAQEAPGEFVPGAESERVRPYTPPATPAKVPTSEEAAPDEDPTPTRELTPDEKQSLEKLFPGKDPDEVPVEPVAVPPRPGTEQPHEGEVVVPPKTAPEGAPVTPPSEPAPAIVPDPEQALKANEEKGPDIYMDMSRVAVFRVLNKQTTRIRNVEVAENNHTVFGPLDIALTECWRAPPDAQPASKALVRILEEKPETKQKTELFYGWLFSANPSLNDLEHPVYDVTLVGCK